MWSGHFRTIGAVVCAVAVHLASCTVKQSELDMEDARIKALADKGAPDSILLDARVLAAEAKAYLKSNPGQVGAKTRELREAISKAETLYAEALVRMGPELQNVRRALTEKKQMLTGLQLRTADSIIAVADSLAGINFLLQAREALGRLESKLPVLMESEKKARAIRPKLVGTWQEVVKPDGVQWPAVRKSVYVFKSDGSLEMSVEKKGQSSADTKEDWKFLSWGTWDLKGDTILMRVTRDKCDHQIYDFLVRKDGKESWERKVGPTYDSTITNGRKDQTITFEDLVADFRKR